MATALAYQYQGLRLSDVASLVQLLKTGIKNSYGPMSERREYVEFEGWLMWARLQGGATAVAASKVQSLDLFPVGDIEAIEHLAEAIGKAPAATQTYMQRLVFERTCSSQILQLSTSGHDLAAEMCFGVVLGYSH